jgi:hypothetical protein
MNNFEVFTEPVMGGYHAMVRTASDAEARPVLGEGGEPRIFGRELDALRSAADNLVRYINGHLVRDGEIAGSVLNDAEARFKPVLRQKGKTRVIAVSYKGRGSRCAKKKSD